MKMEWISVKDMLPLIPMKFDSNLLSLPSWNYDADKLRQLGDWLEEKILNSKFLKYPDTIEKLTEQHLKFMELYERAKVIERKNKEKTSSRTQMFGYRPRLANKNDQSVFDRLSHRKRISIADRKNNEVSKE